VVIAGRTQTVLITHLGTKNILCMRQTNYLHNGAHFPWPPYCHNMLADQQSLQPIPDNTPVDGHGVMALPMWVELQLAELLLEMAQIPAVTQNSQGGMSFYVPLQALPCFNRLTLQPFPYFIYLLHADVSALTPINKFGQIPPSRAQRGKDGPTTTMAPLPMAVAAPNSVKIASGLAPIPIHLTTIVSQRSTAWQLPTDHQRWVITHIMEKVWGILASRDSQVEVVARLVFEPKTCIYLIRKTGEGKSMVVLTSATLLRGITLVVVPLLGLGCDQVAKAQHHRYKVKAYHLDKNRGNIQMAIQTCLQSITQQCSQSIILFTSPQSLKRGLSWAPLLKCLAKRKLFTLLVCNEVSSLRCGILSLL
jgi:hypothetical protein